MGVIRITLRDLAEGLKAYELWIFQARNDLDKLYRRTIFGPFWLTIAMLVHAVALLLVFGPLFGMPASEFMPWIALGLVFWQFIVAYANDSCHVFVNVRNLILQSNRTLFVYLFHCLLKNILISLHHLLAVILILAFYEVPLLRGLPWLLLTVPLFLVNMAWMGTLVAIISTRYRDIPPIITNVLYVGFFITPIMYKPEQLGARAEYLNWNPLNQFLALIREPLLGNSPTSATLIIACVFAATGTLATASVYGATRRAIAFWV